MRLYKRGVKLPVAEGQARVECEYGYTSISFAGYISRLSEFEAREMAAQLARELTREPSDKAPGAFVRKTRAEALRALAEQIGED
jgi:hypothetical protein